jgi:L-alanine-DL-glutamate epimerase-like enolase superfamily enzyme
LIETSQHRQTGRLTVRRITSRAYRVPLNFTLGTSVRTLKVVPLVLVDIQTEEGPVGRSYVFGYADGVHRQSQPALRRLRKSFAASAPRRTALAIS